MMIESVFNLGFLALGIRSDGSRFIDRPMDRRVLVFGIDR